MSLMNVFKPKGTACSAADTERLAYARPRYQIAENDDSHFVDVDLPGVGKKDVSVTLHDGVLELVGERKWDAPKGWKALGGSDERFAYRLRLMVGDRVNESDISAQTSNGVLRLALPKEEEKKPRKIEIN